MSATDSEQLIRDAARRLFAERGYKHVTVRQIAAEAGVSPALVMKLGGSKAVLYKAATPPDPQPLDPDWPNSHIGRELVRRVLERRDSSTAEPWIQALMAVQDSPDPVQARRDFADHYVSRLGDRVNDSGHTMEAAEIMSAMLIGLAVAARTLGLLATDREYLIDRYGALLQAVVDGGEAGVGSQSSAVD